jgi:nitrite reductase/ring-hydroxylating ferredoxin subunit
MLSDSVERLRRRLDLEERRTCYPERFPALPPLPAARYTDPAFYALEQQRLWSRSWLCVGHASETANVGDYRVIDRLAAPIFVIRSQDGRIRAFYNTCQHRGAPVLRDTQGCARRLSCQYHGWTYDTFGALIAVPYEHDFAGLDRRTRPLKAIRCETWQGFVFVNLDADAEPLADFMRPLDADLADELSGPDLRLAFRRTEVTKCNWKIAQEAFLEAYHVPVIHPRTAALVLDYAATAIALLGNGHSRMVHKLHAALQGTAPGARFGLTPIPTAGPVLGEMSSAWGVFPNMTTPLNPYIITLVSFWPIDIANTRVDWSVYGYGWDDEPPPGFGDFCKVFDVVMDEDFRNLAPMQASVASGALRDVPVSYQERRLYHFNQEVDRRIGADRVPAHLRVAPVALPLEPDVYASDPGSA